MSSSTPEALSAAVVTVSDSCSRGERTDLSGPAVADVLKKHSFTIVGTATVPDEQAAIQQVLMGWIDRARLVVTTGGTGIAPRDVTPKPRGRFANASSKAWPNACAAKVQRRLH